MQINSILLWQVRRKQRKLNRNERRRWRWRWRNVPKRLIYAKKAQQNVKMGTTNATSGKMKCSFNDNKNKMKLRTHIIHDRTRTSHSMLLFFCSRTNYGRNKFCIIFNNKKIPSELNCCWNGTSMNNEYSHIN